MHFATHRWTIRAPEVSFKTQLIPRAAEPVVPTAFHTPPQAGRGSGGAGQGSATCQTSARPTCPRTSRVAQLGIGLTLPQEILRRHGTDLVIDESPTGGARFGFQLPAAHPTPVS